MIILPSFSASRAIQNTAATRWFVFGVGPVLMSATIMLSSNVIGQEAKLAKASDTTVSVGSAATGKGALHAVSHSDRIDVLDGESLVTSYRFRSGSKPILWPLIGPDGMRMSREYPMVPDSKNEDHDHPHHRSLWMTFGEVDDLDFWAEGPGKGIVEHQKVVSVSSTPNAQTRDGSSLDGTAAANASSVSIEAEHLWIRPKSSDAAPGVAAEPKSALLREHCVYTIHGTAEQRIIDCEYVLTNIKSDKSAIHFGDTKEGMFAIRVPESMRSDKAGGHILNSAGERDGGTWGRPANWVDYTGKATPTADRIHGIAIMIHPKSYGADGFWHVRTYGLFAHNPIGIKHFIEGKTDSVSDKVRAKAGGVSLAFGESLHLCYRVYLHRGEWSAAENDAKFAEFAASPLKLSSPK